GFPDSLGLLITEVEQEAVGAEAGEVEAEVREMFDASGAELEELPRAGTPSWDIP
ncbi:MAG: hypothetical protein GWN71_10055, partial [Gammaproteobacteria bacterium]|nr:hypothetical protein [Gammaproteobacteria bacterium]